MLKITVDSSRARARIAGLVARARGPEILDAAGHYMAQTALPLRFRQGGPGWAPVQRGGAPLRDTGALAGSFVHRVESPSLVIVSTSAVYAGPQHRGDTVRAKRGKYLAIPLPTLTISERRTKGPRDFPDTKVFKSRAGNLLVWRNRGSKQEPDWQPIFLLRESVQLTARPFMFISDDDVKVMTRRVLAVVLDSHEG